MILAPCFLAALSGANPSPLVPERAPLIYQSSAPLSPEVLGAISSWAAWRPIEAVQAGLQLERCPATTRWTCTARSAVAAPYLLVIEDLGSELSLTLLTVGTALARYQNGVGDDAAVEAAIVASDLAVVRGQKQDLYGLLARLFSGARATLEVTGHWAPNGDLRIEGPEGLEVVVDQQLIGTTAGPATTFTGLRIGAHRVALRDPLGRVEDPGAELKVEQGRTTLYVPRLESGPNLAPQLRTFTFFTGVALSLTGVGLMSWAALSPPERTVLSLCPGGDCPAGTAGFRRSSELGGSDTPSGPLVVPLGYSMLGAGVGMSIGSLALGDEWSWPWAAWLIGLGTFGLSYGLSEALDR
ncbi:MAG: hypothetical protein IPG45_24880 [Deltaproteobacteria bacterium]|jgi:hypothetical protein|nr:hypothetical protein [Deltaproteobacteria bacterium]